MMVRGTSLMGLAKRIAEKGLLSKERVQKILEAAQNNKQSFLREALETGEIDRAQLLQCASEDSGLPLLDLKAFDLSKRPKDLVDRRFIETHGALPLYKRGT